MPFITKTFCMDCDAEVPDVMNHDCPCSPENVAKQAAEDKEWERLMSVWDEWEAVNGALDARASIDHLPTDVLMGKCKFIHDGGYGEGRPYMSPTQLNPTWGDILLLFNAAMRITGDMHHCYLEGLEEASCSKGVMTYRFCTGS